MTRIQLRNLWFSIHKWIGLILAILIIPLSISGAFLVWDAGLDRLLHPARYSVSGTAQRPIEAYLASARPMFAKNEPISRIELPQVSGDPVEVIAQRTGPAEGRPVRVTVFLDPADAHVLDRSASDTGLIRFMHILHGSLFLPDNGRQIVGWIGVAMLISCISGIWLWWPTVGSWLRGFRWRRHPGVNANLHHLIGYWIAVPLAILSFTGMWISFPTTFSAFESAPQSSRGPGGPGGPGQGPPRMRTVPLEKTTTSLADAVAYAGAISQGGVSAIDWPTDKKAEWRIEQPREGKSAIVLVDDATGHPRIDKPKPPAPETTARFMRRLHDGGEMPWLWQLIIFIGGIAPAVLAITGIIMWLRTRKWRAKKRIRAAG